MVGFDFGGLKTMSSKNDAIITGICLDKERPETNGRYRFSGDELVEDTATPSASGTRKRTALGIPAQGGACTLRPKVARKR